MARPPTDNFDLETEVQRIGTDIWEGIRDERPGIFNRDYWVGRVLDWAMEDPSFRTDLFRFVDVFPSLRTSEQVVRHVREYLGREGRDVPAFTAAAVRLASGKFTGKLGARAARRNITQMARQFIVGEDEKKALSVLRDLHESGIAFTADLLGEATLSHAESDIYRERYERLIDALSEEVPRWENDPVIDRAPTGEIPRANVSVKISALEPHLDPVDLDGSVERLSRRLLPLLLRARKRNVFVNFDMEEWELHEITLRFFEKAARHPDLVDWPHIGIVIQAYLTSAIEDAERVLALAKDRGTRVTVRLVKGAYWDHEVVRSEQYGYPLPVFTDKAATDANFEKITRFLMEHHEHLAPAVASHNLRSISHALAFSEQVGLDRTGFEIQTLYGMAEPLRKSLRSRGCRVRVYAPIGELLPGISYLIRRLLENTSNAGFLRQTYREGADLQELLRMPEPLEETEKAGMREAEGSATGKDREAREAASAGAPFKNCAHTDFTDASTRSGFAEAVATCREGLPIEVPLVVNGRERTSERVMERTCPGDTALRTVSVSLAGTDEVDEAVDSADNAWPEWRDRSVEDRAGMLERLADRLEADRSALAALEVWEVAKPWRESDADVVEAIDYCRYYARRARIELTPRTLGDVPGEGNDFIFEGRGPTVVIAPWNFPLAILCGMSTAALVAGNPVILKPAEQSSAVGFAFFRHLRDSGFPDGVIQFLPGIGEEVGDHLVGHPGIAQVAFTGSKAVGLSIIEKAGKTRPGQRQLKRVVCEMGGKNAIVVDADADLDQAVAGVVASAFGYAGQKCSACSRVLVVEGGWDRFTRRLVDACRSLLVAPAHEPACQLGPVVDDDAYKRLTAVIESPGETATPLFIGEAKEGGYYVPAAVFQEEDPASDLMQKELFGPVLAVMKVDGFESALDITMGTEFALTGGVYSRTPSHLALARERFRVGNLYLNRKITGAIVGRQPFGGFQMSGLGTKAGGPGYLRQFAEPRTITENTTRHGFTPEVEM